MRVTNAHIKTSTPAGQRGGSLSFAVYLCSVCFLCPSVSLQWVSLSLARSKAGFWRPYLAGALHEEEDVGEERDADPRHELRAAGAAVVRAALAGLRERARTCVQQLDGAGAWAAKWST
jgi:hypothetical protein